MAKDRPDNIRTREIDRLAGALERRLSEEASEYEPCFVRVLAEVVHEHASRLAIEAATDVQNSLDEIHAQLDERIEDLEAAVDQWDAAQTAEQYRKRVETS